MTLRNLPRLKLIIAVELALLAAGGLVAAWLFWPSGTAGQAGSAGSAAAVQLTGPVIAVPSGMEVQFYDMFVEEDVVRYRFLAPQIGQGSQGEAAADDMQGLCESWVLQNLPDPGHPPAQVIVSLMEKPVELGESRADVVQFFEAFTLGEGICIWEMF